MQRLIGLTTAVLLTTSMANAATLGIPGQGSTQSGVGVISGVEMPGQWSADGPLQWRPRYPAGVWNRATRCPQEQSMS